MLNFTRKPFLLSLLFSCWGLCGTVCAQLPRTYWGSTTPLMPFRLSLGQMPILLTYVDLDGDEDPDLLTCEVEGIKVQWIDDDDDMRRGDLEGDLDSDCLLTDTNNDGVFGGIGDLIIDWNDENGDQIPDIQVVMSPISETEGHYLWQIDHDRDGVLNHIDWRSLTLQASARHGISNFFQDYAGSTSMLRAQMRTAEEGPQTLTWSTPFHCYDPDQDGMTEYTVHLRSETSGDDVAFADSITEATLSFDADNDNDPERPFDFDFTLTMKGGGFTYDEHDVHRFKSLRGLADSDSLFQDPRMRQLTSLTYIDHRKAQRTVFERGEWQEATFVFDEDDDCHRWEQVEPYAPLDPFVAEPGAGGISQPVYSDVSGDRTEWDQDNSGKGQLYLSPLDGKLHLYGAENGVWRVDQQAYYFQGWGEAQGRETEYPAEFVTFLYQDTDSNGFVDEIRIDIDGDHVIDETFSARRLGISDESTLIDPADWTYEEVRGLFSQMADRQWKQAQLALQTAEAYGINPQWYAFFRHPQSIHQKYDYGFWLCFYLYHDLKHLMQDSIDLQNDLYLITRGYLSMNWHPDK